jgi:hypothetical protein
LPQRKQLASPYTLLGVAAPPGRSHTGAGTSGSSSQYETMTKSTDQSHKPIIDARKQFLYASTNIPMRHVGVNGVASQLPIVAGGSPCGGRQMTGTSRVPLASNRPTVIVDKKPSWIARFKHLNSKK